MELRNVGRSGLQVSVVGLGCNNLGGRIDLAASRAVVDRAIDAGITLFDTADTYGKTWGNPCGSEKALGEILGERRKQIVLATKFGNAVDDSGRLQGALRRYVMAAVEASLTRLRTDWIDLYQVHFPDPLTPIEETLRALDDLVRQGKVRYIGCSNFAPWQVVEAQWTALHHGLAAFVCCQDEYSLVSRGVEREGITVMQRYGLGLLPYYPLASGLLTGKYRRGAAAPAGTRFGLSTRQAERWTTEHHWRLVEGLQAFAAEHGRSLVEIAFGWLKSRAPVASVIAGATTPEQVDANVRAAAWTPTAQQMNELDRIAAP